jgi:hypothetical protein
MKPSKYWTSNYLMLLSILLQIRLYKGYPIGANRLPRGIGWGKNR